MKKPEDLFKVKPPSLSEKFQQKSLDYLKAQDELRSSEIRRESLANENIRLSKIIEGLKEELFNKSLALARAEGNLERVDHEDAERAEVVMMQDMKTTRVSLDGMEVNGPAVPIQRAVLKYDLAKPMMHSTDYALAPSSSQYGRETERPKHWVNRH